MKLFSVICHRSNRSNEDGVTIIENLVAICLLGIVLASNSRFIILSMQLNQSSRGYNTLVSDVQDVIDGYRTASYTALLDRFGTSYSGITDGQTVTEVSNSDDAWATFQTTFTAIKTSNTSFPEAVRVRIVATQRRGKVGTTSYTYETYIAQIRT